MWDENTILRIESVGIIIIITIIIMILIITIIIKSWAILDRDSCGMRIEWVGTRAILFRSLIKGGQPCQKSQKL